MNHGFSRHSQGAGTTVSTTLYRGVGATALLGTLLLGGCGGIANDIADAVSNSLVCAATNCKESETVPLDDISPRYKVTQDRGQVRVEAEFGYRSNLLTVVHLSATESISASVGSGQRRDLTDDDGKRKSFSAVFSDASDQPIVTINFVRAGVLHPSTVTIPKSFSVLAPLGTPVIARSAGKFLVQLSQPPGGKLELTMTFNCKRSDGSSFDGKAVSLANFAEGGFYRINTLDLDAELNKFSLAFNPNSPNASPVQSCERLAFEWTSRQTGIVASTLDRNASIVARSIASHSATYDARL